MRINMHTFVVPVVATASLLLPTVSHSQLEEIVVTATKRGSVNVQDVAYNITAIDGDFLDRAGVEDFYGFGRRAGIQAADNGPGEKRFIVRGLSAGNNATVALYYDDIPTTGFGPQGNAGGQPDFRTVDLARVEILRGPQGTLYGASSVGGTIRMVSNKPNLEEFSGNLGIDYAGVSQGGGNNWAIDGVLNVPLIENQLGLRVVGFKTDRDGITDNPFLGLEGVDFQETDGGRAILSWQPSDKMSVIASYWKQNSEVGDRTEYNLSCDPAFNTCFNPPGVTGVVRSTSDNHISTQGLTSPFTEDMDIYGLSITYEFDIGTFTSSTSLFERGSQTVFDSSDQSPPGTAFAVVMEEDNSQFSQEFLFSSSLDGPVNFVVGAFYQDRDSNFEQTAAIAPAGGVASGLEFALNPGPQTLIPLNMDILRDVTNTSIFGEVNWQITERFALDIGARWFRLETDVTQRHIMPPAPFLGISAEEAGGSDDIDDVITKVTASYDFSEDILGYVTYGEGFREGGINPVRVGQTPLAYNPDYVKNYELGLKMELMDNQLVLNTAAYLVKWDDLQVGVPAGLFGASANAGGAESRGFELEATYAPSSIQGLQAQLGIQYTEAEYTDDLPTIDGTGAIVPSTDPLFGKAGDRLPGVADWTLSGNVQYGFPLFEKEAFVLVDWSYTGEANTATRGDLDPLNVIQGGFHLFNLRFGISGDDYGGWSAALYANNLFDKEGLISHTNRANLSPRPNGETVITTYPRTIGFNFRKNF